MQSNQPCEPQAEQACREDHRRQWEAEESQRRFTFYSIKLFGVVASNSSMLAGGRTVWAPLRGGGCPMMRSLDQVRLPLSSTHTAIRAALSFACKQIGTYSSMQGLDAATTLSPLSNHIPLGKQTSTHLLDACSLECAARQ